MECTGNKLSYYTVIMQLTVHKIFHVHCANFYLNRTNLKKNIFSSKLKKLLTLMLTSFKSIWTTVSAILPKCHIIDIHRQYVLIKTNFTIG